MLIKPPQWCTIPTLLGFNTILIMNWSGKLIGGFFGFMLAGPFGIIFGALIGHLFDKGFAKQWHNFGRYSAEQQAQIQHAFFTATFAVMGHIAKSDGHVSEQEIHLAQIMMSQLGLNEEQKKRAIEAFSLGKQTDFNLEKTLAQLLQTCHNNKALLQMFVEMQFRTAMAEGHLTSTKKQLLKMICQRLGLAPLQFSFFGEGANQQYSYQEYHSQQQRHTTGNPSRITLKEAYHTLDVSESTSNADVKRAYRRLISKNHPDKLVSKGLPEEMMKLATEKTQRIKAAYDRICETRGVW